MKIPKTFVPDNPKDISMKFKKQNNKKKPNISLENLVPDIFKGEKKFVSCAYSNHLENRGVNTEIVEKAIWAGYGANYARSLLLIQYKTKADLVSDLKNLFEKGTVIYDKFDIKFSKRFLFESNVVVYLEGSEEFTEEFTQYYKELGFKQLEYELKGV